MIGRSDILAVTTCSSTGFNAYGRRMMQSWDRHWPVRLITYVEGGFRVPVGVGARDIRTITWLRDFQAAPTPKPPSDTYRHDAKRFAWKTAAVIDAATSIKGPRYLIWVDADTFTHADVPNAFIDTLLPTGDEFIAWLWRDRNYPECGFYVLDLHHELMPKIMAMWRCLYETGALFGLSEWHDSWVLQWVIAQFKQIKPKSISGEDGARTNHPFINGPLGVYMDHLKGQRKRRGRSDKSERMVRDEVAYWRR